MSDNMFELMRSEDELKRFIAENPAPRSEAVEQAIQSCRTILDRKIAKLGQGRANSFTTAPSGGF